MLFMYSPDAGIYLPLKQVHSCAHMPYVSELQYIHKYTNEFDLGVTRLLYIALRLAG